MLLELKGLLFFFLCGSSTTSTIQGLVPLVHREIAEMSGADVAEVVDGVAGSEQRLLPGVSPPGLEVAEMVGESWPP